MTKHVIAAEDTIVAVLASNALTPPLRVGSGAALELRAAMARFAMPETHAQRRDEVIVAITSIDLERLDALVRLVTLRRLDRPEIDVVPAIARTVPVEALAIAYGLVDADDQSTLGRVLVDMELVVAVVARGGEPSDEADAAADRLLQMAGRHPMGAVPVVSVLYQSYDATAALIATTLDAGAIGRSRTAAVPRTVRRALADVSFGEHSFDYGDELQLEIGTPALEFGSGSHSCPGRDVAELIAATTVDALARAGYNVDLASVTRDSDGRPTSMTMLTERSSRPAST